MYGKSFCKLKLYRNRVFIVKFNFQQIISTSDFLLDTNKIYI